MNIFPAIDLKDNKVVRLYQGDYDKVTVYGEDVLSVAKSFAAAGAEYLHMVDLDGAKSGKPAAFDIVKSVVDGTSLRVEIGGGIRDAETVEKYLAAGAWRVILGSAAIDSPAFCAEMIKKYGKRVAVGVDARDGMVCIHGWTDKSEVSVDDIFARLQSLGVDCIICSDISKDGAMQGTSLSLYERLGSSYEMDIVASGGVCSIEDIVSLKKMGISGAILGKALYTGAIDLAAAIEVAK